MTEFPKLKHLHMYRDRHGKFRAYYRRKGVRRIQIHGKIGSPQFMASYERAARVSHELKPVPPSRAQRFDVPEGSVVYFVRCGEHVKIGYSSKAATRFVELQTGAPQPLECLLAMRGDRTLEAKLHHRFRKHRVVGEWFKPAKPLMEFIERNAIKQ